MKKSTASQGQLKIDFDYDERVVKLSIELSIMLASIAPPGITRERIKDMATRMALLSSLRLRTDVEPEEKIRCHTCDELTEPDGRARVVVCVRCALDGASPGSDG